MSNMKKVFPVFISCSKLSSPCVICHMARQWKLSFPTSTITTKIVFDLIRVNTRGPYKSITHDGSKYFITIFDDFSITTWIHFLSTKSNAFPVLQSFISMIERQFNSKVKIIKTDNSFELGNDKVQYDFFISKGIIHQTICVYTPQQNGIVERKHKHLLEISRALLYQSYLPISYWGVFLLTTTYLLYRFFSSVLNFKTHFEILFKTKPTYSLLKCFGCLCFMFTLPLHRSKFDPKASPCVFIGYPYGKKGYKVLDIRTKKILVSRDVIFHEEYFPFFCTIWFRSWIISFCS